MRSLLLIFSCLVLGTIAQSTDVPEDLQVLYGHPPDPNDPNYVHYESPAAPPSNLTKREDEMFIHICSEINWGGECKNEKFQPEKCIPFKVGSKSSMGPDHGIQCKLFFNKQCFFVPAEVYSMTDGAMTYPGVENIETYYKTLNNPLSYKCRLCPKGATCEDNKGPVWRTSVKKRGYGPGKNGQCTLFGDTRPQQTNCVTSLNPIVRASPSGLNPVVRVSPSAK
ncbi:hypothetical protein PV10_04555 [Exophiala mesophila]|uniref:Uncharacterized protein n=1 Tax=Exophiala mesophila TaxID=212818 RepID=A0A0D1ZF08_EXOME|nr:uncharacterized protein PV10_04555 [Exophiala mesophila]KIV93337.1 hypothetical protein PV10_04555 [Exophiala mesophila]